MSALVIAGSMPESSPLSARACYPKGAMSDIRSLSAALLSGVTTFCLVTGAGCGTKAVGVEECRDIERERCRAGASCGIVEDVAACERYYRDHCLHGFATKPPSSAVVDACVQVIVAAGRCAAEGADTALAECPETVSQDYGAVKTACDVVAHPELTAECAFLTDTPPDDGSGGQGGQSGAGQESGQGGRSGE
jgi:hypothetical protein